MITLQRPLNCIALHSADRTTGKVNAGYGLCETTKGTWVFIDSGISVYSAEELAMDNIYMPEDGYATIEDAIESIKLEPHLILKRA